MELFLLFSYYGLIAGCVYLAFCFIRRMFNYNLFISIPLDIITGVIIGYLFYFCTIKFSYGELRLYLVLGFFIGMTMLLITLQNFVATLSDFVYNNITKLIIIVKSKFCKRRNKNGSTKTNKNS